MVLRMVFAAMLAAAIAAPSEAQDLTAITAAEKALDAAWASAPLSTRRALYVTQAPNGFGIYEERKGTSFSTAEPVIVYAEPVGYAYRDNGDGTFSFGFSVDLILKKPDGEIVGGQEDFQRLELRSRARNKEFMLSLTLHIQDAPGGDYVLEYRLRDLYSDKVGLISLPMTITK